MTIEERVLLVLRDLPKERRSEVLDFAEFLRERLASSSELRPFGLCKGEFNVPDGFDDPLPEETLQLFENP